MDILYNDLYTFTIVHMENLSTNSELFWWRTISLISWPLQVIISFSMQKKMVNSVQKKSKKPDILISQWSKKLTDSQSNASLECRNI